MRAVVWTGVVGFTVGLAALSGWRPAAGPSTPPSATRSCGMPPAAIRSVSLPRYYSDQRGTVVNAAQRQAHWEIMAPMREFLWKVTGWADKALARSVEGKNNAEALCALMWLTAWAQGEAWLGEMGTRQAEYQRKWDLAGTALAYLKLKSYTTAQQREVIEPWLRQVADLSAAFFDDRERKRNNHWYWMGLAAAAVGMAADSPRHWSFAREVMHDAARDIGSEGLLPHEMNRGPLALHYHAFSAMALVPMAELAAAAGEDWYGFEGGALHRLVAVTSAGFMRADLFETRAGRRQDAKLQATAGWAQLYETRFPDRIAWLPQVNAGHRYLGGDVAALRKTLARQSHVH